MFQGRSNSVKAALTWAVLQWLLIAIISTLPTSGGSEVQSRYSMVSLIRDLPIVVLGQACFMVCVPEIGRLSLYVRETHTLSWYLL